MDMGVTLHGTKNSGKEHHLYLSPAKPRFCRVSEWVEGQRRDSDHSGGLSLSHSGVTFISYSHGRTGGFFLRICVSEFLPQPAISCGKA